MVLIVKMILIIIVIIIIVRSSNDNGESNDTAARQYIMCREARVNTVLIQTNGTLVGLGERGTGRTSVARQNALIMALGAEGAVRSLLPRGDKGTPVAPKHPHGG